MCCPRCRLLQHARLCVDCGDATTRLVELVRMRVEGVTTVARQPPTGWRDHLALWTTALGLVSAGGVGVAITGSAMGLLFAPAVGLFGYSKQFWRTALKRRPRLEAVRARERPAGEALIGTAQLFEGTVAGDALAIATTIESSEGVIVRAIDAAPFWLVLADRRVLVTGDLWVAGAAPERDDAVARVLAELEASALPMARASRKQLRVVRVRLKPGDRIAVTGQVRDEQLPGAGGYRDSLVETIRGEPGAMVWIDRLERAASGGDVARRRSGERPAIRPLTGG